jgi:hypothetical protein
MTTTTTTTAAAEQLAQRHAATIHSLSRYLARTGYPADVIGPAVAEAIVQLDARPDITRAQAYATTVARNEAERLMAERTAAGVEDVTAPDLLAVLSGKRPRRRRRVAEPGQVPATERSSQG